MAILPDKLLFRIVDQLRDVEYFEQVHHDLIEIRDTINAFLCTGHEVYPETMEILNHIMSPELSSMPMNTSLLLLITLT